MLVDCDDDDCAQTPACELTGNPGEPCNGEDDDDDGFVDVHARCIRSRHCIDGACVPLPAADRFEDNDDFNQAVNLGFGTQRELSVHPNDDDFYRLPDCVVAGSMVARVLFNHAQGDVDAAFLDPNGQVLDQGTSVDDDEQISVDFVAGAAPAALRIFLYNGGAPPGNMYTVVLSAQGCQEGGDDPGAGEGCNVVGANRCINGGAQYCAPQADGTHAWSATLQCRGGAACAFGAPCAGSSCQECDANQQCASGHQCLPKHYDRQIHFCARSCELGCAAGTFCQDGFCQPRSPSPECLPDGSGWIHKDGCQAVTAEMECGNRTSCHGRGCVPDDGQCTECQDDADCVEGSGCFPLRSEYAGQAGVFNVCLARCPNGVQCPATPVEDPRWECRNVEFDGDVQPLCFPISASGCHQGDHVVYRCERPTELEQACAADCAQGGCSD